MNKNVFLYGASGHSKVIIDILKLNNFKIINIFDDDTSKKKLLEFNVCKPTRIEEQVNSCVISIGNNIIRQKIAKQFCKLKYAIAIHPKAVLDNTVKVGQGSVIMANAVVNCSTIIGEHCIINTLASVDHDCIISDFVHISPNATLCGNVSIGECSQIGAGSVIIQGVTIGKNVIIGAGSVVIKDVIDNTTVVGNPAKPIKNK
ncbi:acetyltransferase [Lacinutrix sp. Bg11-31]|uniref:acetyltransferase n=1 Tax=Lacinutrix sp. Bg11-31 TaxID=2057808 RepID=UPI000C31A9D8|nr:acetyltransferase [Lacinutrix sp. Bg11-31]AUC82942.1 acetyltransferase [Lacinutrix sp. Bg11-31]